MRYMPLSLRYYFMQNARLVSDRHLMPHCSYQVSEKTVRDIWKGRTWLRDTFHLNSGRAALSDRLQRRPGRP